VRGRGKLAELRGHVRALEPVVSDVTCDLNDVRKKGREKEAKKSGGKGREELGQLVGAHVRPLEPVILCKKAYR
jgi:hypothetical protein